MSDLPVKKVYGFQVGLSGNPLGRPKTNIELRDAARELTQDCLNVLTSICADKRAPSSARVNASISLLDHAWGKPLQHINGVKVRETIEEFLARPELQDVTEQEAREAGLDWDAICAQEAEEAETVLSEDAEEDYTADL